MNAHQWFDVAGALSIAFLLHLLIHRFDRAATKWIKGRRDA